MWFDMDPVPLSWAESSPSRFVNRAVIDAPPEAVFAILADNDQWPKWFGGFKSAEWITDEHGGVGSERYAYLDDLSVRERFIAWDIDRRIAFTATAITLPIVSRLIEDYRLEPTEDGKTALHWEISYALRWYVRPLGFVVRGKFGAMFERATASLVSYVAARGA